MPDQQKPLLSILVTTSSQAAWLRVSLANNAYQVAECPGLVELIVIDDGSTDRTPEIVAEAAAHNPEPNVRFIRNETPRGENAAAIQAINESRGEYVWMLGDDGILMRGALRELLPILQSDDWHPLLYLNTRKFDGQSPPGDHLPATISESESKHVDELGELVPIAADAFTDAHRLVMRREHAKAAYGVLPPGAERWSNPQSTFPLAFYTVRALLSQPAYYVGLPLIACLPIDLACGEHWPIVSTAYWPRVWEQMESAGVPKSVLNVRRAETLRLIDSRNLLSKLTGPIGSGRSDKRPWWKRLLNTGG